jgi:hypothetical protein
LVEPYTGSCTKINIGNPEYNKRRFHLLYGECVFGLTREYRDISTSGKPDVILIGALALILAFENGGDKLVHVAANLYGRGGVKLCHF